MLETWADIDGFQGYYQVSTCGRVRSLDRYVAFRGGTRFCKGRILKPKIDKYGYEVVALQRRDENIRKSVTVHRLVANAFIENPDNKETVNHINGDKLNNSIGNLEWATHKENTRHAITTGLMDIEVYRENMRRINRSNKKKVFQIHGGEVIAEFASISEAVNSVTNGKRKQSASIGACCRGGRKRAYGFEWKFAD